MFGGDRRLHTGAVCAVAFAVFQLQALPSGEILPNDQSCHDGNERGT